jgi:hypothetical protein
MPRSGGRRMLLPWSLPCTTGALVPVLLRPGLMDDATTTGLRCLRRGIRHPPGDEAVGAEYGPDTNQ